MKNHLLALSDFTQDELRALIDRALVIKAERKQGKRHQQLAGKTVCLLFEKPSTRTRVSYSVGVAELGPALWAGVGAGSPRGAALRAARALDPGLLALGLGRVVGSGLGQASPASFTTGGSAAQGKTIQSSVARHPSSGWMRVRGLE